MQYFVMKKTAWRIDSLRFLLTAAEELSSVVTLLPTSGKHCLKFSGS
jgi:hypothetical protein